MFRSAAERKVRAAGYDPARLPPGQHLTAGWPVLHAGEVPPPDTAGWTLRIFGAVEREVVLEDEEGGFRLAVGAGCEAALGRQLQPVREFRAELLAELLAAVASVPLPAPTGPVTLRTPRDTEQFHRRAQVADLAPGFAAALHTAEVTAAHLDRLGETLRRLEPALRSRLLADEARHLGMQRRLAGAMKAHGGAAMPLAVLDHLGEDVDGKFFEEIAVPACGLGAHGAAVIAAAVDLERELADFVRLRGQSHGPVLPRGSTDERKAAISGVTLATVSSQVSSIFCLHTRRREYHGL